MEMTPEKFASLSKEEKLEYYQTEVMPKIKWQFNKYGYLFSVNLEVFHDNSWLYIDNINGNFYDYCYRIKPEQEYIPFTYKDRHLFMGKEVKYKDTDKWGGIVIGFNDTFIFAFHGTWEYEYAFKNLVFADGSPFGKLKV